MTRSIRDLRGTSDEELIAEHDARAVHTSVGTDYYVQELDRRSRDRSTEAALELARRAYWMTFASVAIALLAVGVSIVAFYTGR